MGYLIIRRTHKDSSYIAWIKDTDPISGEMARWLGEQRTTEILEYVPNRDGGTDPFLIPQLNLWGDHLKKEQTDDRD